MQTKFLSEQERGEGRKRLYAFQALNGMGFNFMGETPVYLLAIHFGASNMELGYISSAVFLTGVILLFLPRFLAGGNLIKVQSSAWFIRGIFVLFYMLLFFMEGRSAVILILVVYTLFCSARMIGVVIWNPLVRMVTTSQNRGEVLAVGNIANQSASVISKLVSFVLTSFQYFSGVAGLLFLQIFGVILNSTASWQLRQVPCRDKVEYRKGRNVFVIMKESLSRKDRFFPLMLRWFFTALMVVNGLTIVFVRKEAGFDANFVFLYTMMIALANILSGLFGRTFADRIGSRPLMIGMNIFSSVSYVVWMLLPLSSAGSLPVIFYFLLGFLSNFFMLSSNVLIARVIVNSMPEGDNFGYNAMNNFMMAIFSLMGGLAGGLFIDLGEKASLPIPNSFSFLFFFAMVISILLLIFSLFLVEKGSLSAKEAISILFSLEGLRAYNFIGKLSTTEDPIKQRTVIMSISQNDAPIATEEIRSIIASPLSPGKGEVIKSLFSHPRPELRDDLIREALDSGSYNRDKAIFALGAYDGPDVEETLLMLLDNKDPSIRANAAKSLGRIGHKESLDKISQMASEAEAVWEKINYLIALKNMDETGQIFSLTFISPENHRSGFFRQTYYSLTSDLLGMTPKLSEIYTSRNRKKGSGLKDFLEQTRDIHDFYVHHKELLHWFSKGSWKEIGEFCLSTLSSVEENKGESDTGVNHLADAVIGECRKGLRDYDDALAAVFFSYQIINSLKPR